MSVNVVQTVSAVIGLLRFVGQTTESLLNGHHRNINEMYIINIFDLPQNAYENTPFTHWLQIHEVFGQ